MYGKCECFVMQMFVVVLKPAFCMTCSLLMLAEDGRGILYSRSPDCPVCSHEYLLFPHAVLVNVSIICRGLCACTEML